MTAEPIVRGAEPADFDEIVEMTAVAFGDPDSDWPRTSTERDPNHTPDLHRICIVDGKIVSAMRIVRQKVHYGRAVLNHAGVADVGTLPDYRHHGYSTLVLRDALKHMREIGAHFSILYTGIQPFYERLGWAILPLEVPRFTFRTTRLLPSDETAWVRDFDAHEHLDAVSSLYEEFNARKTATVVRQDRYWKVRFADQLRPDVLVAGRRSVPEAYAVWNVHDKVANVREYAWRTGGDAALRALFAEIDRRGRERGTELIQCQFGADYLGRRIAGDVGERPAPAKWEHMMLRIVDLCSLLAAASEELVGRVEPHSHELLGGTLRICWSDQDAIMRVTESALQVECGSPASATAPAESLELTSAQLVELIFGRGASVLSDATRDLDERARRLLEVCFPGEHFVFWETDSF